MSGRPEISFEELYGLWDEGVRRVAQAPPPLRSELQKVIDSIVPELRRRVGGPFTTDELAAYYLAQGTEWCFELAMRAAPSTPEAWDTATVGAAAYAGATRYASDFGGGRRITEDAS